MTVQAARVNVRVPAVLLALAREEAARCGLTSAQFLSQVLHVGLASRYCQHTPRPAEPAPEPSGPSEAD